MKTFAKIVGFAVVVVVLAAIFFGFLRLLDAEREKKIVFEIVCARAGGVVVRLSSDAAYGGEQGAARCAVVITPEPMR